MTIALIIIGAAAVLGVVRGVSQMRQTGRTGSAVRKCSYCGSRLKLEPGSSKMRVAEVCRRCGRTQPWARVP